jgi:uncharacterized membrane protein YdjX (TVP38/TMEM64 family)
VTHLDLFLFFLYSVPCEFIVSLAPHEPAVLYMATLYPPIVVALVAGAGTLVAEVANFELLHHLRSIEAVARFSRARTMRRLSAAFERAPFAALWLAGLVPLIPFSPLRVFVLVSGYPRAKYLTASVTSRTVRFYLVALLGAALRLSPLTILALFVVLLLAITIPGAYKYLTRTRTGPLTRGESIEKT